MFEEDPLISTDPKAIAIAPDITVHQLNQRINSIRFQSEQFVSIHAHPTIETICTIFAAWRASLPILLLHPSVNCNLVLAPCASDLFLFTSGSGGTPKLASFSRRQLFESARTVSQALKAKPQDRWLLTIPLYHVGGLGVVLRAFCSQGTLVIADKNLSQSDRFASAKADFVSCIPTQLYRLLKEDPPPLSTHFLIGGAPLSASLYQKALQKNLTLSLAYGLTEMSSTVLLSSNPVWDEDGLPFLGFPLRGRELSLSNGEIFLRGAPLFEGYGFPPQKPPEWFAPGDLGSFDPQKGFKILGRKDTLFFSGGENIHPEEIQATLLSLPHLEQAIVVPLFDEEFGARPAAFLKTSLSHEEISSKLSSLLPKYKIPIEFFPLPEDEFLKPNRKKLTELANSQRDKPKYGQKKVPFL